MIVNQISIHFDQIIYGFLDYSRILRIFTTLKLQTKKSKSIKKSILINSCYLNLLLHL